MEPKQLSQELRQGQSPDMNRRRWIIGLSMFGGSMGQLVTLSTKLGLSVTYPTRQDSNFSMQTALMHLNMPTVASILPMDR
jgi:hypothetical protein